jgi:adenine-specific DNA-methyltransferase
MANAKKKANSKNLSPAKRTKRTKSRLVAEVKLYTKRASARADVAVFNIDVSRFLEGLPLEPVFDLIVTSPPYNLGKPYEQRLDIHSYLVWQRTVIQALIPRLKKKGSLCWQVGNFVENGAIEPLDIVLHPLFAAAGLQLRNRIVWQFGHGLHCQRRFSGRYEVILWYTKSNEYVFDLNAVRVAAKYPGKRFYKGPRIGQLSSNPKGKNPEDVWSFPDDVWNIPNVKGNHKEKTIHPCQFPVGLVERLILALTKKKDLVFDPFCGVGSAGVASVLHNRRFWGCELVKEYAQIAKQRIQEALCGQSLYRPHNLPIYDHTMSPLSVRPTR